MTDNVTQRTMWLDQFGAPFATEAEAIYSNERADLKAFLDSAAEDGSVSGLDTCDRVRLADVLLAGYTMTPAA